MYTSLNEYLKKEYGTKVYKLALSAVSTCPNRDGTVGFGGCIFCGEEGAGSFAESFCGSITEQIEKAKLRIKNKTDADKFIAYFQSFTNTYAPIEYLKKVFFEAISHPQVVILSIATRPDCLPDDVLSLLEELNKIKPVWVELGLQTIHEDTARYIRRGYPLSVYDEAVKKLKAIGVKVITHMIIGLPNETAQMATETAKYIGDTGADGIKLQLLHVLAGTDLEKDYLSGKFECLSIEEYVEILRQCLAVLPQGIVVHRITGDGDKKKLIAPLWSGDKKRVLNYINKELKRDIMKNEKILIFGDSYSTFAGFIPDGYAAYYPNEVEEMPRKVNETWWGQLSEETGSEIVLNNSWSGSTICNMGYNGDCSTTNSFIFRLGQLIENGFFEKNQIDRVFVFGGTNDCWTGNALGTVKYSDWTDEDLKIVLPGVSYFINKLLGVIEKEKVWVILNCDLNPEFTAAFIEICKHYGVSYTLLSDIEKIYDHPTVNGMKQIKNQVLEGLN